MHLPKNRTCRHLRLQRVSSTCHCGAHSTSPAHDENTRTSLCAAQHCSEPGFSSPLQGRSAAALVLRGLICDGESVAASRVCGGVREAPRCSRFLLAEPGAHASRMSTAAAKRSNGIAAPHVSHRALTLARTSFADTPRSCTATQYIYRYLCVLVASFNNPREPGTGLEEKFPGTPAAIPTDWESADVE